MRFADGGRPGGSAAGQVRDGSQEHFRPKVVLRGRAVVEREKSMYDKRKRPGARVRRPERAPWEPR